MCNSLLGGERSERRERCGAVVVDEQGYFDHALALINTPGGQSDSQTVVR